MNITTKKIIIDTNIITDLNNANILEDFINLDNIYIIDIIKNDEINSKTGDTNLINKLKIIHATASQLIEATNLSTKEKKLSTYDLLNYIIAKDNNWILATGDNRLKKYCEKNGIEVLRTLKIIKLLKENKIISKQKAIIACNLLKENLNTRIPENYINILINELTKDSVAI